MALPLLLSGTFPTMPVPSLVEIQVLPTEWVPLWAMGMDTAPDGVDPPLGGSIQHVVCARPNRQMMRVDAHRLVAGVKDFKPGWYRAKCQLIRYAMSLSSLSTPTNQSMDAPIPLAVFGPRPQPATIVTTAQNLRPKALFYRFDLAHSAAPHLYNIGKCPGVIVLCLPANANLNVIRLILAISGKINRRRFPCLTFREDGAGNHPNHVLRFIRSCPKYGVQIGLFCNRHYILWDVVGLSHIATTAITRPMAMRVPRMGDRRSMWAVIAA